MDFTEEAIQTKLRSVIRRRVSSISINKFSLQVTKCLSKHKLGECCFFPIPALPPVRAVGISLSFTDVLNSHDHCLIFNFPANYWVTAKRKRKSKGRPKPRWRNVIRNYAGQVPLICQSLVFCHKTPIFVNWLPHFTHSQIGDGYLKASSIQVVFQSSSHIPDPNIHQAFT